MSNERPPRWLVVDPKGRIYSSFPDNPSTIREEAEKLATEFPGQDIHVYQHMTSLRTSDD